MGKSEPAAFASSRQECAGVICSKIWRPDTSRTTCDLNHFSVSRPPGPYKRDIHFILGLFLLCTFLLASCSIDRGFSPEAYAKDQYFKDPNYCEAQQNYKECMKARGWRI